MYMKNELPQFSKIRTEQIEPQIRQILAQNQRQVTELLQQPTFTWDNLMRPLEDQDDVLSKAWSPISHLHSVMESEGLRQVYRNCLPLITEYYTELAQNEKLYAAVKSIADSPAYADFDAAQKKVIEDEIRDFRLAGIHLPADKKARFAELEQQLTEWTTKFSENLLDATQGWYLHITNRAQLAGLPEQTIKLAEENAAQHKKTGWVLTLEYPCYSSAMKFLHDRELRRVMYEAYVTRASDQGPRAGKWDNTPVMKNILRARHEMAQLVGFKNFAEYSLATKMAKHPDKVLKFLHDLLKKSRPVAEKEIAELKQFALETGGLREMQTWDMMYYSEKLRQSKFNFSQEKLRAYFPAQKVIDGMFALVKKIFGLTLKEEKNIDTWHPQVQFFVLYDEQGEFRGGLYTDLYARPHKRDGAWMDEYQSRRRLKDGKIQYPIAYLTCNFMRPLDNKPALLTHEDVETLFHEFGHCLHHLVTKVDYAPVSGINGVPWDAVEFPSQFMENWCWEKETLAMISSHYQTGETLPENLYQQLIATRQFQAALQMLRQLEFAIFDFRIHLEFHPDHSAQIENILQEVRQQTNLMDVPTFNRFQHSFAHIFAGSYCAGYYSYKWAEVLSCDAFEKFKEHGTFDPTSGRSFLQNILEAGGVKDPLVAFVAFRGREPQVDALLRQSGLM